MHMLPPRPQRRSALATRGGQYSAPALGINVDQDGAPISSPAVEWFVCFVPGCASNGGIALRMQGTSMYMQCARSGAVNG